MAKQGSIKHYRQEGDTKAPESLPYSELAVAKDGTVYAGNENDAPVELAKANETMPKTGGTFTGDVAAISANRAGSVLRNCVVVDSAGNEVSTNSLRFVRK